MAKIGPICGVCSGRVERTLRSIDTGTDYSICVNGHRAPPASIFDPLVNAKAALVQWNELRDDHGLPK